MGSLFNSQYRLAGKFYAKLQPARDLTTFTQSDTLRAWLLISPTIQELLIIELTEIVLNSSIHHYNYASRVSLKENTQRSVNYSSCL